MLKKSLLGVFASQRSGVRSPPSPPKPETAAVFPAAVFLSTAEILSAVSCSGRLKGAPFRGTLLFPAAWILLLSRTAPEGCPVPLVFPAGYAGLSLPACCQRLSLTLRGSSIILKMPAAGWILNSNLVRQNQNHTARVGFVIWWT